jgi:putative methionine-R-sulfoxide reductase with GAF domain
MTSNQNQNQKAVGMTVYQKRTFYLALLLAGAAMLIVVFNYFLLAPGEQFTATLNVLAVGIFVALGSAYLAHQNRVTSAVIVLIMTLFMTIGFALTQITGLGIYLVIFNATVSLGIVSQTLPAEKFNRINLIILLASAGLVLLDLYYPYPRTPAVNPTITIVITIVVVVVVAVLVLREFPRYMVRTKMALTFLVTTLIPLLIMAAYNNYATRDILITGANENLLASATQTANRLDAFVDTNLSVVRSEARLLTLGDLDISNVSTELTIGDRSRIGTFLRAYSSKDPYLIRSYAFLDLNGVVFADTVHTNVGQDESNWDYFQQALATPQPYASSVQFMRNDQGRLEGYIHFSHIVYNQHGYAVGVLRARYDAAILQQLIVESGETVGDNSYFALYDTNGFALAHSLDEARRYQFLIWPDPNVVVRMRSNGLIPTNLQLTRHSENNAELAQKLSQYTTAPTFEAVDTAVGPDANLVAVTASERQPWLVAAFQPQTAVLPPIAVQTRSTSLLSLLLAGLAIVVAFAISGQLVRPLTNLHQTADQITSGDLGARTAVTSQDEFGALGQAFNTMAEQLQQTLASLEIRVLERTRALEVASQVSRSLSTILDPDQLVKTVVEQVQTAFNYYHAHIYLVDEEKNTLRMVGGTGNAGQMMLEQGHSIPYGKGLVGHAAAANEAVLIPNVADNPDWLPNPLLPDTQAEIAVPIALGDEVLGVLDVQHDTINGLSDRDANLLQAVANQVAIALRNAHEYRQAQARAERQQLLNQINQKILTTQNMEEALQIAVRELGQAVGATRTRARLHAVQSTNGDANGTTEG